MMYSFFAAPLLSLTLLASQPAPGPDEAAREQGAQTAQLSMEQNASLRCSAAFALVAYGQSRGNAAALKWPKMETRGREFFVLTTASLMEDAQLSREAVTELMAAEAQGLIDDNAVEQVMPACLLMLEGSGL